MVSKMAIPREIPRDVSYLLQAEKQKTCEVAVSPRFARLLERVFRPEKKQ